MGESMSQETLERIVTMIEADPAVSAVLESPSMYMAPEEVFLILVIDFNDRLTIDDINRTIPAIRQTIRQQFPLVKRIIIEPGVAGQPTV